MLFVLRLLPPMKKVAQKIILVAFFFNFAVTMIATVSYGVKCIPFTAVYKDIPNAKCLSERVITSTQYVNAGELHVFSSFSFRPLLAKQDIPLASCLNTLYTQLLLSTHLARSLEGENPLVVRLYVCQPDFTDLVLVFACVIDITTALIPQFLLWKVQMRRSTKLILDIIFAFGFVTAGLSIGRAATTNNGIWKEDSTWRVMPSDTFSLVEHHAGIFFASCPAVRQFFAYRKRVGTIYPSDRRQEPNADFVKMRRKINLRDIFWYRQASATKGRVYDALPIFQQSPDTSDMPQTAVSDAEKSPLDVWREKLSNKISKPSPANTQTGGSSSAQSNNGGFLQWLGMRDLRPGFYWRGGGEPLRSIESARRARLEMSANRAHAWPGLGSALAKRDVARKVDDFDLPWERRRESLSNAPHGSTGAAHGANASSETTPPPRDDTESMQILAEPAATRGRVERATPARELYRTRDHGATYERLGSPKAL